MFDWKADFAPAVAEDAARSPCHFMLHYHLASERALCRVLRHIGLEPTILTFTRRLSRRQKRKIVVRHWLPGYMFLHFDVALDRWQQARRAPGALGFLGDPPQPLSAEDFHDLQARCPAKMLEGNDEFTVIPIGSEVEVLSGPFIGRTGLVSKSRGRSAWVELIAFNRPSSIELRTRDIRILR